MTTPLKPLIIGAKTFDTNLIQAPLAGISCAPFRELVWQFGGIAYCCTEMLSAQHLARGIDRSPRYHTKFANEGPLCWQLSGNHPDIMAKASERAIALGADLIDLNCGCPQPKIRKKGCGSKLLTDEHKLSALVQAMRQDPSIPVTVKIRVDYDHGEHCDINVVKMLEQAGADAIIVHGRHWSHDYETPCQLEAIAKIVESVSLPVIGNGDIHDAASLQNMFTQTGCAGFMIARASVGQPWLFQQLTAELQGQSFQPPTSDQIGQLFLQHLHGLIELEGETNAILQCRKFGKYYAQHLPNQNDFLKQFYQIDQVTDVEQCIRQFF